MSDPDPAPPRPQNISERLTAIAEDIRTETRLTQSSEREISRLKRHNAALETEVRVLRAIKSGTRTICSCKTAERLEQQIDALRKQIKVVERKNALLDVGRTTRTAEN